MNASESDHFLQQHINRPQREEFQWSFLCHVHVPGGDNESAMATIRPCASGDTIPALPFPCILKVVPPQSYPPQRGPAFFQPATKATLQNKATWVNRALQCLDQFKAHCDFTAILYKVYVFEATEFAVWN